MGPAGRHIDAGEYPARAAAREVADETGFGVVANILELLGWQRFTLLEVPPDWYPHPHPRSYTHMFVTRTERPSPLVLPPAGSERGPAEWCDLELVTRRCARASWLPFVTLARD